MNKRIVILGAGESGAGSAVLAQQKGFDVFVSDSGSVKAKYREILVSHNIAFEEGKHTPELIMNAGEVIKSPGLHEDNPLVVAIREKGIPVISEIEFAGRYTDAVKICVTGSNGKTTTTNLIYHMMKKAGLNVAMTGNVGNSFAMAVAQGGYDYYVIELSSFQLDGMYDFRAEIAILMNITPDHLDRYDHEMQNYVDSKMRVIRNQTGADHFIWCADDPITAREVAARIIDAHSLPFSIDRREGMAASIENENLILNITEKTSLMTIHDLALKGRHNTYLSLIHI